MRSLSFLLANTLFSHYPEGPASPRRKPGFPHPSGSRGKYTFAHTTYLFLQSGPSKIKTQVPLKLQIYSIFLFVLPSFSF